MKDEKITLTLSADYLAHWTVYDALRELYQNVFDRANEDGDTEWFSDATKNKNGDVHLALGNMNTELSRKTLILGVTSKRDSKNSIGKFGEGYKLAILVLLREGIDVSLVTGHEKWVFTLEHTPQFGMKMLTVTVKQLPKSKESKDLTFAISGIPKKTWSSYSQYNLLLQKKLKVIETRSCNVLTDKRNRAKIFIGGLYVCKYSGTSLYGYDFHPHVFELGRDRNIVDGFNASWQASKALTQATIENLEIMSNVIDNISETDDTMYVKNFVDSSHVLLDAMWNKFITSFPDTIPITNEWSKKSMQDKYTNIKLTIVNNREFDLLIKSEGYNKAIKALDLRPPLPTPSEVVNLFYDNHNEDMGDTLKAVYAKELMTEAVNWKLED